MDNALAGTLQMFQSRAVPWGGINRGPKRQQLKTFKLFTISKANGRRNRPDLHHFPGNRPGPNQKLVASHSEYAYFGASIELFGLHNGPAEASVAAFEESLPDWAEPFRDR